MEEKTFTDSVLALIERGREELNDVIEELDSYINKICFEINMANLVKGKIRDYTIGSYKGWADSLINYDIARVLNNKDTEEHILREIRLEAFIEFEGFQNEFFSQIKNEEKDYINGVINLYCIRNKNLSATANGSIELFGEFFGMENDLIFSLSLDGIDRCG